MSCATAAVFRSPGLGSATTPQAPRSCRRRRGSSSPRSPTARWPSRRRIACRWNGWLKRTGCWKGATRPVRWCSRLDRRRTNVYRTPYTLIPMPRSSKSPLLPVERAASLGDRVYELLREYLRSGEVRWGEALREATLAARLGVSRTPVREALARLASEGLAEAQGRSFTVPALTEDDLQDIYELRVLLE